MSEPAILTHVEVHFTHGEPLIFTMSSLTDFKYPTPDALEWELRHEDGSIERIVVDPKQVRYTRTLERPVIEDEDAKVASLVNGDNA